MNKRVCPKCSYSGRMFTMERRSDGYTTCNECDFRGLHPVFTEEIGKADNHICGNDKCKKEFISSNPMHVTTELPPPIGVINIKLCPECVQKVLDKRPMGFKSHTKEDLKSVDLRKFPKDY